MKTNSIMLVFYDYLIEKHGCFSKLLLFLFTTSMMCHSRITNNNINRLHERYLRLIYNEKQYSFHELLERDGSVSMDKQNLRFLAIGMFKKMKGTAPTLVREMFPLHEENRYKLGNRNGLESLSYLGPEIWETLPLDLKQLNHSQNLKAKLRNGTLKIVHPNFPRQTCKILVLFEFFVSRNFICRWMVRQF